MSATPLERGRLAAEMAIFLESLATDSSIPLGYREEAQRLVEAADEAWGKPSNPTTT